MILQASLYLYAVAAVQREHKMPFILQLCAVFPLRIKHALGTLETSMAAQSTVVDVVLATYNIYIAPRTAQHQ